jgi:hypothetical protein
MPRDAPVTNAIDPCHFIENPLAVGALRAE